MAIIGEITYTTTYTYAKPVTFGTHRAMFRRGAVLPRACFAGLRKTSLASKIHWISDAQSNAVTVIDFGEDGRELTFSFQVRGIYSANASPAVKPCRR